MTPDEEAYWHETWREEGEAAEERFAAIHGDGGISRAHAARIADAVMAEDVAPSSDGSPTSGSRRRNAHLDAYGDPRIV